MLFGKKKAKDCDISQSANLVQENALQIKCIISLAEFHKEIYGKLKEMEIKIKYFSPSTLSQAVSLDKKIQSSIGDIKIALSRANATKNYSYCEELVDGLLLLVAQRKSITA